MNFIIESTTDILNSTGGIALVGKIFQDIGLNFESDTVLKSAEKSILRILAGLLTQGRSSFAEVSLLANDPLFQKALNLERVYAPETVRIYLDRWAKKGNEKLYEHVLALLGQSNLNLIKSVSLSRIRTKNGNYVPVDIDVSPMDNSNTKKEAVGWTYRCFNGYSPIFSYIGTEGYMLDCELRPGQQNCQKGTPEFLRNTMRMVDELTLSDSVLFRLDSGNDAFDNLKMLLKSPYYFVIKKNRRTEKREDWLRIAQERGFAEEQRAGKTVYTGVLRGQHPKASKKDALPDINQIFRITERTIDRSGNLLLFPDIEVELYWSNLDETPEKVIELYHGHATSEQFHSELKSDMDVERLPSGKFKVNSVILHLAMIAFNTLRKTGQSAMGYPEDLPYQHTGSRRPKRKRLRKVIDDLMRISCRLVYHARRWIMKFYIGDPWYPVFRKIYEGFG